MRQGPTTGELRRLTNDELDARAALRLGGGVACDSAAEVGRGFADGRVVVYAGKAGDAGNDRPPAAHTADGRWSPTRDAATAFALEDLVRRRGLEELYVCALLDLAGGGQGGELPHDARGLFAVVHSSPRHRTIAALVAAGAS